MSDSGSRKVMLGSGILWDPDCPRVEDVRAVDFLAMAGIGRWGGHARCKRTGRQYMLSQHGLFVARLLESWGCPPHVVLQGASHDLHEVYPPGDVPGPRLRGDGALATALREEEKRARDTFRLAVGLPLVFDPRVHDADMVVLATERRDLLPPGCDEHFAGLPAPLPATIQVLPGELAYEMWVDLYKRFGGVLP